jgi:hypothetical protein
LKKPSKTHLGLVGFHPLLAADVLVPDANRRGQVRVGVTKERHIRKDQRRHKRDGQQERQEEASKEMANGFSRGITHLATYLRTCWLPKQSLVVLTPNAGVKAKSVSGLQRKGPRKETADM